MDRDLKSRFWSTFICLFFLYNSILIWTQPRNTVPNIWIFFAWASRMFSLKSRLTHLLSTFFPSTQNLLWSPMQNSATFHFRKQMLFPQHKLLSVTEALVLPWLSDWGMVETSEILSPQWSAQSCGKHGLLDQPWCLFPSLSHPPLPNLSFPALKYLVFFFFFPHYIAFIWNCYLLTGLEGGGMENIGELFLPFLILSHGPFILFSLPCPAEEGSDRTALVPILQQLETLPMCSVSTSLREFSLQNWREFRWVCTNWFFMWF